MARGVQNFGEQRVNPIDLYLDQQELRNLRNPLNFNLSLKLHGQFTTWISSLDNPEGI